MGYFSVEAALVAWLKSLGYEAAQLMQADRPGVFVTVDRTGGGVSDFVQAASVAVQVWADTNEQAERAAGALCVSMLTTRPPAGIHSIYITDGPYDWPDLETGRARYQIVMDVYAQLVD